MNLETADEIPASTQTVARRRFGRKSPPPHPDHCLDCGEPVSGHYCANCGQETTAHILSTKELARDVIGEYFSWDSKFFATIKPLFARPGFLTNEYIAGRRERYLMPSRVYMLVAVLMFLLASTFDPITYDQTGWGYAGIDPKLAGLHLTRATFDEKFQAGVLNVLPIFMLGMIPLCALGLKFLYRRSKRLYVEHLVFAFHFISFAFLVLLPANIIGNTFASIIFSLLPIYLFMAIHKVYHQSLWKSIVKTIVAYCAFFTLLSGFIALAERYTVVAILYL